MSVLWRLAERLNTVPREADVVMRVRSGAWWAMPRTMGCEHAPSTEPWFIVYPRPEVLCGLCALHLLAETSACLYCGDAVPGAAGEYVVHESRESIVILSVAHRRCLGVDR